MGLLVNYEMTINETKLAAMRPCLINIVPCVLNSIYLAENTPDLLLVISIHLMDTLELRSTRKNKIGWQNEEWHEQKQKKQKKKQYIFLVCFVPSGPNEDMSYTLGTGDRVQQQHVSECFWWHCTMDKRSLIIVPFWIDFPANHARLATNVNLMSYGADYFVELGYHLF